MLLHGQFLEGCVMLVFLVIIWKFLVIGILSILFVLAHFPISWHLNKNDLIEFFCDFVPSLHYKHHVRFGINHFLLGHMLTMFAFDECKNFVLFPIFMPLSRCLISNSWRSSTSNSTSTSKHGHIPDVFILWVFLAELGGAWCAKLCGA